MNSELNEILARITALELILMAAVQQLDAQGFKDDLAHTKAVAMSAFDYSSSDEAIARISKHLDRFQQAIGLL